MTVDPARPALPKLSFWTKTAWGVGGAAENIFSNAFILLALPIYSIGLGIRAEWIGMALMVPRLLDTAINPLLGNLSDNTRTRFGRRRIWILGGGALACLSFVATWHPPLNWAASASLIFFIACSMVFYLAFDLFAISYNALGLELTSDYNERTNVQAYRLAFIVISSIAANWLYKLCSLPALTGAVPEGVKAEVMGVRSLSLWVGIFLFAAILVPVLFCREGAEVQKQPKISLLAAVRFTFTNRLFLRFMAVFLTSLLGPFLIGPLGSYMIIYYVTGGDKEFAGTLLGWGGTLGAIVGLLSVPAISTMARVLGKRASLMIGQVAICVGGILTWVLYTPAHPWLSLAGGALMSFGIPVFLMLFNSVLADICDLDELEHGLRREGMFTAVSSLLNKLTQSVTVGLAGGLIALAGFLDGATVQPASAIFNLRIFFAIIPSLFAVLGFAMTIGLPISHARATKVREALTIRYQGSEAL